MVNNMIMFFKISIILCILLNNVFAFNLISNQNGCFVTWTNAIDMLETSGYFEAPFCSQKPLSHQSFLTMEYKITNNLKHLKIRPNENVLVDRLSYCITSEGVVGYGIVVPEISNITLLIESNTRKYGISKHYVTQFSGNLDVDIGCYDIKLYVQSNKYQASCPSKYKYPRYIALYGLMNTDPLMSVNILNTLTLPIALPNQPKIRNNQYNIIGLSY
jgi:hypothetical protein